MNKQELVKKMNEELFESEMNDREFFILSLIKQHFEENYNDENNEIIKSLAKYDDPLMTAYEIFTDSVDIQKVLEKVYQDFFDKGSVEKIQTTYFDKNLIEDTFDEETGNDTESDDECLIHDNEDC